MLLEKTYSSIYTRHNNQGAASLNRQVSEISAASKIFCATDESFHKTYRRWYFYENL